MASGRCVEGAHVRVHPSRPRWHRAAAAALAAPLVLSALAAAGPAPEAAAAGAAPAAVPAAAGAAAQTAVRALLLIDGTVLNTRQLPGGGQAVTVRTAARPGSLVSLAFGQHRQEIPADALPYLGRGLDPSLFDLAALQHAETHGVLPVRVFFSGRAPRLPGITVTRSGPGSEHGYLTAAGAAAFGAALARQFRADHAGGRHGQGGMFAGGVDIALPGAPVPAARPARPGFRLHNLTMAATNLNGRPDTGDAVIVLNADNPARFEDPIESMSAFDHGTAKFSVPAGHYWAIGDFFSFTGKAAERLVVLPQFTVRHDRTVRMSERSASSEIGFTTPRPATLQLTSFTMIRRSARGRAFSAGFIDQGVSLRVSPTSRKPTVGTLRTFTAGQLTSSPDGANAAYAYNLNYAGPDGIIPATQHYDVTQASLATVHDRYFQDVRSHGSWGAFGIFRAELTGFFIALAFPFSLPGRQVQYYTAAPSLAWSAFYQEYESFSVFGAGQGDAFRVYAGGQKVSEDWNAYPLHPQPDVQPLSGNLGAALPVLVSASRTANALTLAPNPFSDNYPGHIGGLAFSFATGKVLADGSYAVYQNGKKIAHGNPVDGIKPVTLSPRPSVLRFELSEARSPDAKFPLSTAATTTWTWRSVPQAGATVPRNWVCGYTRLGAPLRRCAVQPLMTLSYHVRGLPLDGRAPAGAQQVELTAGHIQLARSAGVTGATAQVSYNDGQTFRPATVTPSRGGRFLVSFTAPAGVDVTLRVSATDAAGGSITETIVRAYGVAS